MKRSFLLLACWFLACAPDAPKPARFVARHDALSTGVVISEVYGGGGVATSTYRHDFVELLNRGTAAVDVSGWSVQYASDTGGSWLVTSLGTFGALQPGQSLLVRLGTAGSAGMTLPAHDVSGGSAMASAAGKVALVNSTTGLTGTCPPASSYVDLVGYGSAASCAEGGPTPNTSPTTSVSRIGNGCTETDSNSNDFTVSGPTPRSSMDSVITCGVTPPVDAGTTPVDAGTTPTDAGCLQLASWPVANTAGGYDAPQETTWGELNTEIPSRADGGMDVLTLEAYFGNGLTLPATETFNASSTYATCEVCALLSRGCDSTGACAKDFFARAGTASVTFASQDEQNGQLTGSLTSMRFVEWDFMNDQAVPGGDCVELAAQNVNLTWGAGPTGGGGGGGGSATGGGSGGGSATGGGTGGSDAGVTEADAGTGGGDGKLGGQSGCGCTTGAEAPLALLFLCALGFWRRRTRSFRVG